MGSSLEISVLSTWFFKISYETLIAVVEYCGDIYVCPA
jgi:hypothetical protein